LIYARDECFVESEWRGFAGVAAEPHGDTNMIEATLRDEAEISVLDPASPRAFIGFAFQTVAQIDAAAKILECARRLAGNERLDSIRATLSAAGT
jgi:hypothetical protein